MTEKQKEILINNISVRLMARKMAYDAGNDSMYERQGFVFQGMKTALRILGYNVIVSEDEQGIRVDIVADAE